MHQPADEFARFHQRLCTGGWLAIMTTFLNNDDGSVDWSYRRDITHVVFYRETTFRHIAGEFGWECIVPRKNTVLMRKR